MQSRWDIPWGPPSKPDNSANMRVSDAERNEIGEQLSKHYSDGRLDATEFQERLDRAMSSKTRADLSGLLDDLPSLTTPQPVPVMRPPRRHRLARVVLLLVFFLSALSFVQFWLGHFPWVVWPHVPWLVIGLIALFIWRRDRHHHRYGYRRRDLDNRPQ